MNTFRWFGAAASLLAVVAWVASCGPNETSCTSNQDCAAGEQCNASACQPATDAGIDETACVPSSLCRPAMGPCDVAETCDYTGHCPADSYIAAANNALCRPAVNACDLPEYCDGTSGECPADAFEEANTPCAAATCENGQTTPARYCAGGSATCNDVVAISCNGYQCDGSTCGTSCTTDDQCLSTHYCKTGNQCSPKRADGEACSGAASGFECLSGICTLSFFDSDGDGYGVGTSAYFCGTPASGHRAEVAGDCCDADSEAHPGQTAFFTTQTACANWDFDCNGVATYEYNGTNSCKEYGSCGSYDLMCNDSLGWSGARPGCGVTAKYVTSCTTTPTCNQSTCPGCDSCDTPTTGNQTQGCR